MRAWSARRGSRSNVPYAASCTRACLKRYVACGATPCRKSNPAATSRSSAKLTSASGLPTTLATSACENSRPIAAPICATSFAGPRRSRRAIREACKLGGTVRAGMEPPQQCAPTRFRFQFQHRLRHFLHKQRDTISVRDDVLANAWRKQLVTDDAVNQGTNFALCQPVDSERGHVRPSNPRRVELGPKRHNQQHPEGWYLVDDATEQFEAGGVGPMCILENNQQWVLARQGRSVGNECVERPLPTLLRCKVEHRVTSVVGQRQHVGK